MLKNFLTRTEEDEHRTIFCEAANNQLDQMHSGKWTDTVIVIDRYRD